MSSQGGIQKKGDTSLKDVSGQARQVFTIRAVATCRRITRQKGVASKKKHLICFLNEPRIFRDKSVWSHRYAETIGVAGRVLILVSLWLIDISVDRFLLHSWIFFSFSSNSLCAKSFCTVLFKIWTRNNGLPVLLF